jgi:regulator of cell morphogenesis and NO signaling
MSNLSDAVEANMSNAKTICTVCNYIYDEAQGEPRQNIAPSVEFASLNEAWRCPECNSGKDMFQPCTCVSLPIYESTCVGHGDKKPVSQVNSSQAISKTMSVGEVVAQYPASACIFEQLSIDYCCGGKISLEEACRKRGLDADQVVKKLADVTTNNVPAPELDWTQVSLKELIDHIVSVYHNPLRYELGRILALSEKVAHRHGENHPEVVELLKVFAPCKEELELHMQKEEMILFPTIAQRESQNKPISFGCGGGIEHPIGVMMSEHDSVGETMEKMRKLTNSYTPPEDACNSYKQLFHSLARFELEMHQHVHKENNILFPRAIELFGAGSGNAQSCMTAK